MSDGKYVPPGGNQPTNSPGMNKPVGSLGELSKEDAKQFAVSGSLTEEQRKKRDEQQESGRTPAEQKKEDERRSKLTPEQRKEEDARTAPRKGDIGGPKRMDTTDTTESRNKAREERRRLMAEREEILKEFGGNETDVPRDNNYWNLGNQLRALPEEK